MASTRPVAASCTRTRATPFFRNATATSCGPGPLGEVGDTIPPGAGAEVGGGEGGNGCVAVIAAANPVVLPSASVAVAEIAVPVGTATPWNVTLNPAATLPEPSVVTSLKPRNRLNGPALGSAAKISTRYVVSASVPFSDPVTVRSEPLTVAEVSVGGTSRRLGPEVPVGVYGTPRL